MIKEKSSYVGSLYMSCCSICGEIYMVDDDGHTCKKIKITDGNIKNKTVKDERGR